MQTTTQNLLRSTPDLSLDVGLEKTNNRGNWRTRSAHVAHKPASPSVRQRPTTPNNDSYGQHIAPSTLDINVLPPLPTNPARRPCSVSPHHNRSLSFRNMKRPTPQQIQREAQEGEEFRSRGATMPSDSASYYMARRRIRSRIGKEDDQNGSTVSPPIHEPGDEEDDEYYLLRIFSITSKGGIINEGDYVKQRSRSNNSVASTGSTGGNATSCASLATSYSSGGPGRGPTYRVLIIGALGVGKTELVTQFMTSEYMNTYDTQDEDAEKCVSILLDGIEYELVFMDNPLPSANVNDVNSENPDAYVIIYSVTERQSFEKAVDMLFGLKEKGVTTSKAVILVANKSDLARSREVATEEGKSVACSYECKFIETSACINHNVDELLVGIVSQIRLKSRQNQERKPPPPAPSSPFRKWGSTKGSFRSSLRARGIFNRILGKGPKRSKSCENLHVL